MNQILYMNDQKNSGGPLEIKTILRIFAITCIVFGIFLVAQASIAMVNSKSEIVSEGVPLVTVGREANKLNISVTHDKLIDKIVYSWSKNKETILQGKGRNTIEETIDIPQGTNVLSLKVIDIDGKTVSYSEEYTATEGDKTKPVIELEDPQNQKVKIVVKDETELAYMSYYWNEEDETKVEVNENSPKLIEEKIDILKGENILTVIAVDKAGNEAVKEQTYKGATKPKINAVREGNNLIIKVVDEEEIQKIEYVLNGVYYSTDPQNTGATLGTKQVEFKQAIAEGENTITITAYNISGLKTEFSGQIASN